MTLKGCDPMSAEEIFGKRLAELRAQRNLTVSQLAEQLFVSKSTVSRWENGSRMPDLSMLSRVAAFFGVPYTELLGAMKPMDEQPTVMLVDDEIIILRGTLDVVEQALPNAAVYGFTVPSQALQFARSCRVDLALMDIELGKTSGFELCRELSDINPRTNIIFVTGYPDYALEAWGTGACGFLVKPLRRDALLAQLERLRYPVAGLSPLPPRKVPITDHTR